jgi:hypothetical protein
MPQTQRVSLSEIRHIDRSELRESRLNTLLNGYLPFEKVLESSSDPIALYPGTKPYDICDGRHRIYLARQKGYSSVSVVFA